MKKFPFLPQLDPMDCGPACIRMIAQYFGKSYSSHTLRRLSGMTREGASLLGISEAAEAIGFLTKAVATSLDIVQAQGLLPFIAYWPREHFIVVYKIKGPRVWVADPAQDLLRYPKEEFTRRWTGGDEGLGTAGIGLLLEPGPGFYEAEDEKNKTQ